MTWVCGFTICFCNVVVCGWVTVLRTVGETADVDREGRQEVSPTKDWGVSKERPFISMKTVLIWRKSKESDLFY